MRDTEVFDRATLPPGTQIAGPAIVEEFGSTSVVFPGQALHVDDHGIRPVQPGLAQQPVGILGLGDHVVTGVREQTDDPLSGEHRVIGHD